MYIDGAQLPGRIALQLVSRLSAAAPSLNTVPISKIVVCISHLDTKTLENIVQGEKFPFNKNVDALQLLLSDIIVLSSVRMAPGSILSVITNRYYLAWQ